MMVACDLHYLKPKMIVIENGIEVTYRYMIGFIDDKTRYLLHYGFLKRKNTTETTKELLLLLNKLPQHKFACLHTDNGAEFKGTFKGLLRHNGIDLYLSKAYSPWMNGKIERFWKTMESFLN